MKRAAAVLALVAVLAACKDEPPAVVSGPAPELGVLGPGEQAVTLADFRGRVVLVNFWFATCGPCLAEMPDLEAYYRSHKGEGFEILAVNMGDDEQTIAATGRRLALSFPLLGDPLKIAATRYKVSGAPTSFVIDRNGILRGRIEGSLTPKELERRVGGLL